MRNKAAAWIIAGLLVFVGVTDARAKMPVLSGSTPTLYGGERLEPHSIVLGATTGYPETRFDAYFGVTQIFDLGVHFGLTYGARLSGLRQRVGMDLNVPLRFTLVQAGILAFGLRVTPYFMIGEARPSVSVGGDIGFLFDIALPKLFKIIVGPEVRSGFASTGIPSARVRGYDGGSWVDIGVETLFLGRFHVGGQFQGGAQWGRHGVDGVFRTLIYFGARL